MPIGERVTSYCFIKWFSERLTRCDLRLICNCEIHEWHEWLCAYEDVIDIFTSIGKYSNRFSRYRVELYCLFFLENMKLLHQNMYDRKWKHFECITSQIWFFIFWIWLCIVRIRSFVFRFLYFIFRIWSLKFRIWCLVFRIRSFIVQMQWKPSKKNKFLNESINQFIFGVWWRTRMQRDNVR